MSCTYERGKKKNICYSMILFIYVHSFQFYWFISQPDEIPALIVFLLVLGFSPVWYQRLACTLWDCLLAFMGALHIAYFTPKGDKIWWNLLYETECFMAFIFRKTTKKRGNLCRRLQGGKTPHIDPHPNLTQLMCCRRCLRCIKLWKTVSST